MSTSKQSPEEVLKLAQAVLAQGAPVKVRSYVKHSSKGKAVVVREALRGAAGGSGRTPISSPTAQTTPVISNKALQSETAAARAGVAQQRAALAAARKQAAAALKAQKQQQKNQKKQKTAKKQPATKAPKQPATKAPKMPKLGGLGGLGALGALNGGGGGSALRGRPGRLFPGSRALGSAIGRSRKARTARDKEASKTKSFAERDAARAQEHAARLEERAARHAAMQARERHTREPLNHHSSSNSLYHTSPLHRALYQQSARKVKPEVRRQIESDHGRYTEAAHRALEIAAAYRRAHGHGKHSVDVNFHDKLAGEVMKHEARKLQSKIHLSNSELDDNPVAQAQEALRIEGYPVEVTGEMNDETSQALADFLAKEGVDIDADFSE